MIDLMILTLMSFFSRKWNRLTDAEKLRLIAKYRSVGY